MIDSTDMSTPMTRGEFAQFEVRLEQMLAQLATKAELAQLATKAELTQLATKAELTQLATKAELEIWGGALLARIASGEQRLLASIELLERRMLKQLDSSEQRLLAELARHTRASHEEMSTQVSVIDEKYADLPLRVSQLETEVFATKQR